MTDQLQTLRDDVGFLRSLAEEGRNGPILGRSVLLALTVISGVYGGAALIVGATGLAYQSGLLNARAVQAVVAPLWYGSFLITAATLLWLTWSALARRAPERRHPATAAALRALIFAFVAIFGGFVILSGRGQGSAYSLLPTIVLALYGAGWSVAAGMMGRLWFKAVAGGAMMFAVLSAATFDSRSFNFVWVLGSAFLLLGFAPGLKLLRQARAQ